MSSVGSFFSYVNDARSHETEVNDFSIIRPVMSVHYTDYTVVATEVVIANCFRP